MAVLMASVIVLTANAADGNRVYRRFAAMQRMAANADTTSTSDVVIITSENPKMVADSLTSAGRYAKVVGKNTVTAWLPKGGMKDIKGRKGLRRVEKSRRNHILTDVVREETGADKVHNGEGLDTPFTGKGVIVGIIDEGFEWGHIAFKDSTGASRVKRTWNRSEYGKTSTSPTSEVPSGADDFTNASGHGTHVAGIAAGSRVSGHDYYGIAPEADLVLISSSFEDAEMMEDIEYLLAYSDSVGMPCVVNISAGNYYGSHDGTTLAERFTDEALGVKNGFMVCYAAGNIGNQNIHAQHTFTKDNETVYVLFDNADYGVETEIWSQTADSAKHLDYSIFTYENSRFSSVSGSKRKNYVEEENYINSANKKQCIYIYADTRLLTSTSRFGSDKQLCVAISGDKGTTIHVWSGDPEYTGVIAEGSDNTFLKPDDLNGVANNSEKALIVGAYTTKTQWDAADGYRYTIEEQEGDYASFSSSGPSLTTNPKPDISAPGCMVASSMSKYYNGFSRKGEYVVDKVTKDGETYYYEVMEGTSMASPAVTGAVALWLQANPNLSAEQIKEIAITTARKDEYTGDSIWSRYFGYGKIDVYEGLKAALQAADEAGIVSVYDADKPVTLQKESGSWKVLFNSAQTAASIAIIAVNGTVVSSQSLGKVSKGEERTISLDFLPHGTYIISIATPGDITTRKFIK